MVSSVCLTFVLLAVVAVYGDGEATTSSTRGSVVTDTSRPNNDSTISTTPSSSTKESSTTTSSPRSTVTSIASTTPTTTNPETTAATTSASTTTTTTTGPTTTNTDPTTTTTGPTTTTTDPETTTTSTTTTETTTSSNTTTTTTTSTTTSASTTTTTVSPVPPVGPSDDPAVVGWHVSGKNAVCLLLTTGIQLRVSYPVAENKTSTAVLNVPSNGTSMGSCADRELLNITYPAATIGNSTYNVSVGFTLASNSTQSTYRLHSISVSVPLVGRLLPNISDDTSSGYWTTNVNLTDEIPSLSVNTSYRCLSHRVFALISDSRQHLSGQLMLVKTELEGFRRSNTTKFGPPLVCAADRQNTSDVVPIAVGVSLALLVVLILVGYLVAQRRHRRNQYQSI